MGRCELDISVFPAFRRRLTNRWLREVVERTLEPEETEAVSLSLVIADDETVRRLNRTHRGLDEVTDVLSFGLDEPAQDRFVLPAAATRYLGEVILSYPQAERQARQQGHRVRREVALLVAHGALHLLGYDHAEPEEEAEMWARQNRVLAEVL